MTESLLCAKQLAQNEKEHHKKIKPVRITVYF
jgi:hypothetical protein